MIRYCCPFNRNSGVNQFQCSFHYFLSKYGYYIEINLDNKKFVSPSIISQRLYSMKTMTLVCKDCGHEQRIKIYAPEELKKLGIRPVRPRCRKCGSTNINLYA